MNTELKQQAIEKIIEKWDRKLIENRNEMDFTELTFSSGIPGVVLLLAEYGLREGFPNYSNKIETYIEHMVYKLSRYGMLTGSIYSGASGIALSILHLQEQPNYHNLFNSLNDYIVYYVEEQIKSIDIDEISPLDYDIIEGLAGILNYLLLLNDSHYDEQKVKIVNYLSNLANMEDKLLKFYIKPNNQMSELENNVYPKGCLNLGLAHGLSGVGCVLCYAYRKGFGNNQTLIAIKNILKIYEDFELSDLQPFIWKDSLTKEEITTNKIIHQANFIRDAWCYGSPGISLFYLYSGLILNDTYLKDKAEKILKASMDRLYGVDTNMLCHGYTGIIQICSLFKKILGTNSFNNYIEEFIGKEDEVIKSFGDDELEFLEGLSGCLLAFNELEDSTKLSYWKQPLLLFEDFS